VKKFFFAVFHSEQNKNMNTLRESTDFDETKTTPLTVETIVKVSKSIFAKHPEIREAKLFGSFSKGKQTPQSDVDFLVDVDPSSNFDIMDLVNLQTELEEALHRPVDVLDKDAIKPGSWAVNSILNAPTNIKVFCQTETSIH
jgi:predicted nucleotidyltransferase